MNKKIIKSICCAFLLSLGFVSCSQAQHRTSFSGTLIFRDFYGAPNYGENPETDNVETVPVLDLDLPLIFKDETGNETFVSQMQVLVSNSKTDLRNLENRKVKIKGTVSKAETGHHHTDMILAAEKIEARN